MEKIKKNLMYKYLLFLTIASTVGLQGWRTLFNNFAVDTVGIDGFWVGVIQSVREIPGFLALLVIFVLIFLPEHKLSAVSVTLMGLGVFLTGFLPSHFGLVLTTLIMSTGFHFFETTNQSLTLQYFSKTDSATVMAKLKSYSALTNIGVGFSIWLLAHLLSLEVMFGIIGAAVVAIGFVSFFRDPVDKSLPAQKKKMVLKKKYWLFYTLNFFAGARRQIFVVFAVFLLVKNYHFSVQAITVLFVINNVVNFLFMPLVAKAINRFGERKVLSLEYGSLVLIFLAYAFVRNPYIVGALYVLDQLFFNFSIGIKTYFQKNAEKEDIAPSMAVSFTINHITAVFLPFVGGVLWMSNWKLPFIAGSALSLVSLIFVQMIKTKSDNN